MFWLGTHEVSWLKRTTVPLMISHRRLMLRKQLPRASAPWVLDSGGYSELSMFGSWQTTPQTYVAAVRRYMDEIGMLTWAAVQDWMCEPWVTDKTGFDVLEHQYRSVVSYLELRLRAPDVPWVPVLQGWDESDYLHHRDMFEQAGVDLSVLPVIGIGSVCRRQGTLGAINVLVRLKADGLRLHGFGLKTTALRSLDRFLVSSDSMAWSFRARRKQLTCGVPPSSCKNHLHYALEWRDSVVQRMGTASVQLGIAW
jgi:hypothetical protein